MRAFLSCAVFLSLTVFSESQLIRQCTCSEIASCRKGYVSNVKPCADRCQKYATSLNANYPALKRCVLQREGLMKKTVQCTESSFPNACAKAPGRFVQKRHLESLEIAGVAEINRMLSATGVANEVQNILAQGRKFMRCAKSCLDKSANKCAEKLNCGFDLPSDNTLVATSKQCAIRSGFNTRTVQDICRCFVGAGMKQLTNICPRLQVIQ